MNRSHVSPSNQLRRRRTTRIASVWALFLLSAIFTSAFASVRNGDAAGPAAAIVSPDQSTPAGFGRLDPTPPAGITPQQIIAKFGDRETAFAKARDQYTFRQSVTIETIAEDSNRVDGVYKQVTDIVFGDDGRRTEHVVFAPQNTIERLYIAQEDFDDIAHRLPFVLTAAELPDYDLTYLGRQRVDEVDTFVFDCHPKVLVKGKRYFQGKVWVDQQEYEIVLINGKSVPDDLRRGHENLSPPYTTYYSEVDGGYWFPVYTKAEATLHFSGQDGALANDVHIRYVVKYEDYKRFHAKSRIIYNGQDLPPADPNAAVPDASGTKPQEAQPSDLPPPDPNALAITRPKKGSR